MSIVFKKTASEKATLKVIKRKFKMEKKHIPAYLGKRGMMLGLGISTAQVEQFNKKDKTVFVKLAGLLKAQETIEALSFDTQATA